MAKQKGGFTLPGEAGYEALTLELAQKWGADVIRDSDGTALSSEILAAGYDIYSTLCVIREHNAFAVSHPHCRQQTVLCTAPRVQSGEALAIDLMTDFFDQQFELNDCEESRAYWQVVDLTSNQPLNTWHYADGMVHVQGAQWHRYAVYFFAYRIWEEISMYNHTTNHWTKEHLMQIDPVEPDTMDYLTGWMEAWCRQHPQTSVVRFTSLFYNFAWIWGASERNRHLFTDWSSYDFTVSPRALRQFEARYGYPMTLSDFANKGLRRPGHTVPDAKKRDWMAFINDLVIREARKLVDITHRYGKKAYVFYDDSWIGLEPSGKRFPEFGFDGLIKCVFSGFEVRLCANALCDTHEIRLHPYLFPVGLGGLPTFKKGGDPTRDARQYWMHVRRALLRQPVDRIGLGGYLHLTEGFPDFVDCIAEIAEEFRILRDLHQDGAPQSLRPRVGILTAYGALRAWTLSGHFHETDAHDLIHVLESLSGLAFDVSFVSFEDIAQGVPEGIDVLIIAGQAGTAWSGGGCWREDRAVEAVTAFAHQGGAVIGIGEPSALAGYDTYLRLSHILGVDIDDGRYHCHGKWQFDVAENELIPQGTAIPVRKDVRLADCSAQVLYAADGVPLLVENAVGKGKGIYLSSYRYSEANTRLLQNLILHAAHVPLLPRYVPSNPLTECAWFAQQKKLAVINNASTAQHTRIETEEGPLDIALPPYALVIL